MAANDPATQQNGNPNSEPVSNASSPSEDERLIKCRPGDDGEVVLVALKQIQQSHTFNNMYRDLNLNAADDVFEFPMPAVKQDIFKKVVDWTANHIGVPDPVVKEDPATRERTWFELNDYEKKFFDVPVDVLADLLTAGNYLDIRSLYLYGCQSMAALIKNKSPEEIRELFGLEDDLTEDEKAEIRKQNVWCNY
ncbi:skp1 family, dimerization domain-containing protein [Ditylenchus destructor]|nr:skp1 family, dimerization domain-containing protein [Ditylenchus destructor]